ncbi:hypothetical protein [Rhodopseudomonas palustris]|uniref:hypothetical protein n=1 Tax=Rhodopseudomonas palustris TaxID=1076 RepID=UPI000CEC62A9|nr:hypothetical protein [Rhodopseudomonas palustris]PPQ42164.1 hypothetical protein CKO39_18410 [Rhodopseudomonas palustris]
MSLARTALRLLAVAIVQGEAGNRPTIAEGRVYDSRIDDLAPEEFASDARPTVIVLTDGDEGDALSAQNGGPSFARVVDISFQLGMIQSLRQNKEFIVGYPDTDARLEASLDLLEHQVVRRFGHALDALPALFRRLVRIRKRNSNREVLSDAGVKLACFVLTLQCQFNDDDHLPTDPAATGFDLLPPMLRKVANALPAESAGRDTCKAIAAALEPKPLTPLEGIDIAVNVAGVDREAVPDISMPLDFPNQD